TAQRPHGLTMLAQDAAQAIERPRHAIRVTDLLAQCPRRLIQRDRLRQVPAVPGHARQVVGADCQGKGSAYPLIQLPRLLQKTTRLCEIAHQEGKIADAIAAPRKFYSVDGERTGSGQTLLIEHQRLGELPLIAPESPEIVQRRAQPPAISQRAPEGDALC